MGGIYSRLQCCQKGVYSTNPEEGLGETSWMNIGQGLSSNQHFRCLLPCTVNNGQSMEYITPYQPRDQGLILIAWHM